MSQDVFDQTPRRESYQSSKSARKLTALARIFTSLSIRRHPDETADDIHGPDGLSLLVDSAEPYADIVFVHGLGGGSRKTWDKGNDPQLYWPKEWLSRDPEFKRARIHTFGYHANWVERSESVLNIHDFANALLSQLQASSTIRRGKQMPIIFVCHSMGGLVVKRALILSQHDKAFRDLSKRFDAIYFLATPHNGAGSAQLLSTILKATYSGSRPFVVDLGKDSPAIQAINDEFRHYALDLSLYSFFETKPTSIGGVDTFIVPKTSAIMSLPNERVNPIRADHRGACKFDSPSDPNYILVRNCIIETLDRIAESWTVANDAAIKAQKRTIRNFLHISDQLNDFHVDFGEARVDGSCEWLTKTPAFGRWRDAHDPRLLWLKGNPGTGKSFIAKYVVDHLRDLGSDCSCFFFRAGDKLHSSLTGCLLSLAWQMAESNLSIRDRFLELSENGNQFDAENFQSIWRTLFVGGVLHTKLARPHYWVLDGLDEFGNYGDIFPLLSKICSGSTIQIMLTSRPSPDAQSDFSGNGLAGAIIEITQSDSLLDIKRYVESHADFPSMQGESDRKELLSIILTKSEGSFLWVRLVLKELRGALSVEATKKVLDSVPKGMDSLYSRSLAPLARDAGRKSAAEAILMWASACIRPLNTMELKEALVLHIQQTFNNLENHISWLCGYLITVDRGSIVKIVHETARSFVLNPQNDAVIGFDEAEAHEALAIVCLKQLNLKELKAPRGRRPNISQTGEIAKRSPFMEYAAMSFHEHIGKSKTISNEILDLLYEFLISKDGYILSWIEFVVKNSHGLATVTRAGMLLQSFAKRVGKNPMRRTERLDLIQSWSTDLIRVVTRFGRNLAESPSSIYTTIPPFCPRNSALYRQFGHSPRGINLLGVPSLLEWDDCLATIVYRQKGNRAMSIAATGNYFAIGTSSPYLRLYHTSTCQEFADFHHGESVKVIELSMTGQWVATGGNKRLCLWDIDTRTLRWLHQLSRPCVAITFTEENDQVVVACQDNILHYLDIATGQTRDEIPWFMDEDHSEPITNSVATATLSFQHKLLAFVYRGGHIGIWNWEDDEFNGFCEKPDARNRRCPFHASSLVFSPVRTSNSLAAAYEQGEIIVFDPLQGAVRASYKAHTDNQTLACSPDGRTLISGDSLGVIRIFDFQCFDDQRMRLLYLISGVEENIGGLAFCDDKRFVDIRGPKVKVWEPTILVRQDSTMSDTESITSEQLLDKDPDVEEVDVITSLTVHPDGKHIFYATQNGLINVSDVTTGKHLQTIVDDPAGDTVIWMILSRNDNILATGGISSKLVIRRLEHHKQWSIAEKLFEYRMGEQIEQLLFNPANNRILVVTTARDLIYSLNDSSTTSHSWNTRLPGIWCNDPRDPENLLLWVNQTLRVFTWAAMKEVSPPSGITLGFDLPSGFGIQNVYTDWKDNCIATVYSEINHSRSQIRLIFWDLNDIAKLVVANNVSDDLHEILPHRNYSSYGRQVSSLVGTLGMIIGIFGQRILFLDQDGWICSVFLADSPLDTYIRHFSLPSDWLSTDDTLLVALTVKNEILFGKGHELAIIKRGLDSSHPVQLPASSTSTSSFT